MAYLNDTDEQKKQGTPGQPGMLSTPSAQTAGGGALAAGKPTQSGSFVNLQKYVDANSGNDTTMGNALQQTVQNKANDADKAVNNWQTGAAKTVADNTYQNNNMDLADMATGNTGGYSGTEKDYTDFKGYEDAKNAAQGVQDYTKTVTSNGTAGLQTGLRDTFGANGQHYNNGQSLLDATILGRGAGGQTALKNISSTFGNYSGKFDNAATAVNKAVTDARNKDHSADAEKRRAEGMFGPGGLGANISLGSDTTNAIQDAASKAAASSAPDLSNVSGTGYRSSPVQTGNSPLAGVSGYGAKNTAKSESPSTPFVNIGNWMKKVEKPKEEEPNEYRTNGPW